MKKFMRFSTMLAAMVLAIQAALAAAPANYYNRALNKSDEALMSALCSIIKTHKEVSYSSGLLKAFATADTDDQGYIIDIYSNCRYRPSDSGSSASHVGEGYNREHSFPRSWFGGEVAPMNTDVFHIYPTDIKVNSQRSNFPYGVCSGGTRLSYGQYVAKGKLGTCTYPGYSGTVFEPDDEYKGDLARSYFYMVTCYKDVLPSWPGSAQLDYSRNKYKAFSTWTINMLMEWTRLDPVSEKEIKRNEAVYGIQGNRNPFIDHPELAEYIWGNMQGQPWPGSGHEIPAVITSPTNGTIVDMGSTTIDNELHYTVTVKGEGLTRGLTLSMTENDHFYVSKNSFSASEVNSGTSFVVSFTADEEGSFENSITLSSDEVSTMITIKAIAIDDNPGPGPGPDPVMGDSITEDWEYCETGGYWTDRIVGNAFDWDFSNAGIWGDNLKHGDLSCRLGKSNDSMIAMAQDYNGGSSGIRFWAGSFGSDADATLNVDYSTDKGASWTTLSTVTVTKGSLQEFKLIAKVKGPVRYRIAQTQGSRVNIDDITLYAFVLPGDVNGDGEVNIADVNALIDAIMSGNIHSRCDVNQDKEVNVSDVNAVIDLILAS